MISSEKKKKKKRKRFARSISNSGVHVIEKRSRRIWQYIIKNGYYIVRCLIYVGYMRYRGNGGWLLFVFPNTPSSEYEETRKELPYEETYVTLRD